MLETIKNFFISLFAEEQKTYNNKENSTAMHRRANSNNSFCSTSATQEERSILEKEDNEIKPIINEGKFRKTNFYDKELIKDILNDKKNKSKTTKAIKNSIIENHKITEVGFYETHVESYTKEQEKINNYNYRT